MINCSKCLDKCKAVCCGAIPFKREFIKKHKPIREVIQEHEIMDELILETKDNYCPYLKEDYTCGVYKDRPEVCRLYGFESEILLTCQYQDKDGRIRSRQEKRAVEREILKSADRVNKRLIKDIDNYLNKPNGK